jgi:hypothetical protein
MKINESRFDPSDCNAASEAAEDALLLADTMLRWRAESWPGDPTINDGGWAEQCARIIDKYGFEEQIPELYRRGKSSRLKER